MYPVLLAAVLMILPCTAAAQFDQLSWTLTGNPDGWGFVTPEAMHVTGPDGDTACSISGQPYAGLTSFAATAPFDGTINVHIVFDNQDFGGSEWHFEHPVFVLNGAVDIFNDWGGQTSFDFEGDFSFEVSAGDAFGWGIWSIDCKYGPGVVDLTQFEYVPDGWGDLGHALPGSSGAPLLAGFGTLVPGGLLKLQLDDALPGAPAYLVLGFSSLMAPFKGGVMVPDPAAAGMVLPFTVGPVGRIVIVANWPAGVPAGLLLRSQYWIADPAGPVVFAASNARVVQTQ